MKKTAWAAALCSVCTAVCLLVPRPGYAIPSDGTTVPDPGVPPVASGTLRLPGTTVAGAPTPVAGPLGVRIMNESVAVEALGQQLQQLNADLAAAEQATLTAYQSWQDALDVYQATQQKAATAAAKAYEQAQAMGPFSQYAQQVHQLGMLAPGLGGSVLPGVGDGVGGGPAGSEAAAIDATTAKARAANAFTAYQAALTNQQDLTVRQRTLQTTFTTRSATLAVLRSQNTLALAAAELARERADQLLLARFNPGSDVNGMVANPRAIAAVHFALNQLGKPYLWGSEGPDSFDCSGLTWASYRSVGVIIPRIAADQQHAITPVPVSGLLPGDLLFFSTTSRTDWTQISHVAMYLGDGKMVEAPSTGEVVKITTVWWSAFFSAGRVLPAIPGPSGPPPPSPSPSPSPAPAPSPTPSPSPSPSNSPTPTPSPSDTTSPSTSPSSSPSPSGSPNTPSPSASGSTSPSASAAVASDSPNPTPTPS